MRTPTHPLARLALTGALVLGMAGCGGGDDGEPITSDVEPDVAVLGTDALKFEPERLSAPAGEVAIELTSGPGVVHDVTISGETVVEVPRGGTGVGTIELDAGEYTFYCSIPGHRTAGMEGTLTVE